LSMSESHTYRQVGANEDCPCGSGKKHIDCCLDSNNRWVVDEKGTLIRMQTFKGAPLAEESTVEEMTLLRMEVSGGKCTYQKNSHMSRLSSFPPDVLKMAISVIEIEKVQATMEAFSKYLERTQGGIGDEEADKDRLEDGTYMLLVVSVDEQTGTPVGIGGRRVSEMMSESSLMLFVGALEEIKSEFQLCLTVNSLMNGLIGTIDYGDE